MLFQDDATTEAIAAIARMAKKATKDELAIVLNAARAKKPAGFDQHCREVAKRYRGNTIADFKKLLVERFPNTHLQMPKAPLNLVKFVAAQDAGVYEEEPDRKLVADELAEDGQTSEVDVPAEDPRSKNFAWLVEMADLAVKMPEAEQRALIPMPVVVHYGWVQAAGDDEGRPRLTLYWPQDVLVLNHPWAPIDPTLDFAVFVALRQASPDGGKSGDWWWCFSREVTTDDEGRPTFGPWYESMLSTEGEQQGANAAPRPLKSKLLPIALLQVGEPEGSMFVDEERDLPATLDEMNVMAANEQYAGNMQGHSQLWTDSQSDADEIAIGADLAIKVQQGAQLGVVDFNPKLDEMRNTRKTRMRELSATRSNSPDAYDVESKAPESGVSREIANRPHDAKLRRLRHVFRVFENTRQLPILIDLCNTFTTRKIEGCRPVMTPRLPARVEDQNQKQMRLVEAKDGGGITEAHCWTEAGYYPSIDAAVKAGLSNELKPKPLAPQGGPPLSPFQARLQGARPAQEEPPPVEGEDDAEEP